MIPIRTDKASQGSSSPALNGKMMPHRPMGPYGCFLESGTPMAAVKPPAKVFAFEAPNFEAGGLPLE